MYRNRQKPSHFVISIVLIFAFFIVGLPFLATHLFSAPTNQSPEFKALSIPKTINVYRCKSHKVEKINFEDYITCVVASEMPNTFHSEALKAQAVAARTYALAKIVKYKTSKPKSHPNAPICDSTHCQAYHTKAQLLKVHEKSWESAGYEKIRRAVYATKGKVLYHNNKLVMQPLYFSSSGGHTENSQDVFVGTYPYLVSVSSPYEAKASHRDEKTKMPIRKFARAMKNVFPKKKFGSITKSSIKILKRTHGGRVAKIKVGKTTLTGIEMRNALGLSSSLFSIGFSGSNIVIVTNGSGHGVGMSQYGADGMARKGYSYEQILKHYYTGVEIY